uniref:Helo_like_N domain-containing protein n=1 Tax=Globodera pallida TaxID=36090 RepID=A0A183CCJ1_GLOPA
MVSSATEMVVEFLSKFEALSSSSADVGSFMERISLSSFALLKLAFPIGSLVASSLHIATKPESDEYRALIKLRDTMDRKFEEISRTITVAGKVIAMDSQIQDYINNVRVPAKNLHQQMALFWNPAVEKLSADVEAFKQDCYYSPQRHGTPLGILN